MNNAILRSRKKGYNKTFSISDQQLKLTGVSHVDGHIQHSDTEPFQIVKIFPNNFSVVKVNLLRATLSEAIEFKKFLEVIINEGSNNILIDINSCSFIDSTFFGVIVGALKKVNATEGNLYLIYDEDKRLPLFTETGLAKIFTTFKNEEEAYSKLDLG